MEKKSKENLKNILRIIEIVYVSLLTVGYLLNIKRYAKNSIEGGIGKFYTLILGVGILIIYYRLFIVKKKFMWYEYIMIILNILAILINFYYGVFMALGNYMFLLFSLYFLYYPSIRHKITLNKWDKLMYVFMVGMVLIISIFTILMVFLLN